MTERAAKLSDLNDSRTQREISTLRKSLNLERNLKLDAYQRVDELQSQVYDLEAVENMTTTARSQTTMSTFNKSKKMVKKFLIIF